MHTPIGPNNGNNTAVSLRIEKSEVEEDEVKMSENRHRENTAQRGRETE